MQICDTTASQEGGPQPVGGSSHDGKNGSPRSLMKGATVRPAPLWSAPFPADPTQWAIGACSVGVPKKATGLETPHKDRGRGGNQEHLAPGSGMLSPDSAFKLPHR